MMISLDQLFLVVLIEMNASPQFHPQYILEANGYYPLHYFEQNIQVSYLALQITDRCKTTMRTLQKF
tara:strand:+ start:9228 stop:9428 length:201 start_codon:yes stop_codon:yes gene_type:complete